MPSSCSTTYLVLVWSHAEVLDGLAGVLWSTEEDDVRASWCAESELIESDGLTTGGLDAGAGSRSEAEGADAELGNLEHAVVVGDSSNNGADLALVLLAGVLGGRDSDDLGERHRWGVDARHAQSGVVSGFVPSHPSVEALSGSPLFLRTSSRRWH